MRVALAVLLVSLNSSAAEHAWEKIGTGAAKEGLVLYVDRPSVKTVSDKDAHGGVGWFKAVNPKTGRDAWNQYVLVDCVLRTFGTLSYVVYNSDGHAITSENYSNPRMVPVPPESFAEAMLEAICVAH